MNAYAWLAWPIVATGAITLLYVFLDSWKGGIKSERDVLRRGLDEAESTLRSAFLRIQGHDELIAKVHKRLEEFEHQVMRLDAKIPEPGQHQPMRR